ncbi:MAG: SDR family oxidoreductase [Planctomycetes bacterium]|nr:SDR family oxidoreductase [Planctomycetota bacterium]
MATYLVTGGAGFIGSHLVDALVERGHETRVIDNFDTGREENLAHHGNGVTVFRADIRDAEAVERAMRGVDYVLHEAALPSVAKSVLDPITSHEANVNGTLNLLWAAHRASVKRFVYAASSSAYGETPVLPKVEDMREDPISPYGVGKFVGELYARCFAKIYGLHTICLRYFNVFGPRQVFDSPYTGVIAIFIHALLNGEAPKVFGDGEQTRDFNYIANTVQANLLACTADAPPGSTFNIAGGKRITINELCAMLSELTGQDSAPEHLEERTGDIKHSLADIAAARTVLGYEPTVDVREGLSRTVEWYKSLREAGSAAR